MERRKLLQNIFTEASNIIFKLVENEKEKSAAKTLDLKVENRNIVGNYQQPRPASLELEREIRCQAEPREDKLL